METITHTNEQSNSGKAILKANFKQLGGDNKLIFDRLLKGEKVNSFNSIGLTFHSRISDVRTFLKRTYNIELNKELNKTHSRYCYDYWLDNFSIIRIKESC